VRPAFNVRLIGIRHADRQPVHRRVAGLRQVKNILVAIGHIPMRTDRFEMAHRNLLARARLNRHGFNPVKRVLQREQFAHLQNQLMRQ
jgi:hypothetical protein